MKTLAVEIKAVLSANGATYEYTLLVGGQVVSQPVYLTVGEHQTVNGRAAVALARILGGDGGGA